MTRTNYVQILLTILFVAFATSAYAQKSGNDMVAAKKARDDAAVEDLQRIAVAANASATKSGRFDDYAELAQIQIYLCEAIESHHDDAIFKTAAEEGVKAAEQAARIKPDSSLGHQLLGDLLNQLIPHEFGGGMKLGNRANDELDKALKLDPSNAEAMVSRAISYHYTPTAFGGDKQKAVALLSKAARTDEAFDSPHIWLALFYLEDGQIKEAASEIVTALKLNPNRAFTKYVALQIKAK
ncbi:MAG: hypothetical protein JO314_05005 [Acidobacteria bacterium]|nr:hypothetical protein [Acidobacteriota bacterium]